METSRKRRGPEFVPIVPFAAESVPSHYLQSCVYGPGAESDLPALYRALLEYLPAQALPGAGPVSVAARDRYWRQQYGEPTLETVCAQLARIFAQRPDLLPLPAIAPSSYPARQPGIAGLPRELLLSIAQLAGRGAAASTVSRSFARTFGAVRLPEARLYQRFVQLADFLVRIGIRAEQSVAAEIEAAHRAFGPITSSVPIDLVNLWYSTRPPFVLFIEGDQFERSIPGPPRCLEYWLTWPVFEQPLPPSLRRYADLRPAPAPHAPLNANTPPFALTAEELGGALRSSLRYRLFDARALVEAFAYGILMGGRRIVVESWVRIAAVFVALQSRYRVLAVIFRVAENFRSPGPATIAERIDNATIDADAFAVAMEDPAFAEAFGAALDELPNVPTATGHYGRSSVPIPQCMPSVHYTMSPDR